VERGGPHACVGSGGREELFAETGRPRPLRGGGINLAGRGYGLFAVCQERQRRVLIQGGPMRATKTTQATSA